MIKCPKCGVGPFEKPLQRINPKGEIGIFYCWDCIKKYEPELYKNEKADLNDITKLLIETNYPKGKVKHILKK